MSRNISKDKREDLLSKIKQLRAFLETQNATPEMRAYLSELESELKRQKFGLVFEEHKEEIDDILETHTPILKEDKNLFVNNGGQMNFVIEGDNLASLTLLEKTHKGKIDVIYIDPPYNTGAKDWKYNNDYVDGNDLFRHSKWLSMMEARLKIAKQLLAPRGALICAIDENELHTTGMLLENLFGLTHEIHCVTIIHNPGGVQGKNFSYTHEYAIFVIPKGERVIGLQTRTDNPDIRNAINESKVRADARNCFFPIYIKDEKIIGFGEVCLDSFHPKSANEDIGDGVIAVYPIDKNGNERNWRLSRQTIDQMIDELKVEYNSSRKLYDIVRTKTKFNHKTVWFDGKYNANVFGTRILRQVIPNCNFDFPKSLYNVQDCVGAIVAPKNATILDFFAGSGTTGHAVLELNKADGGQRKFILCSCKDNGNDICREVTYERVKTVITGKRKDGSKYGEPMKASLKYQKVEFLPTAEKIYYDYADELLKHIKELVELENAINFDGNTELEIILTETDVEKFFANQDKLSQVKVIYLGHDVSISLAEQKILSKNNIALNIIPEYYYKEVQV